MADFSVQDLSSSQTQSSLQASPQVVLKVSSIDKSVNKKAYKTQNNCVICNVNFAKGGPVSVQKHTCRFCYQAVCSSCSPLTAIHPSTNNLERICIPCYTRYLKEEIERENEAEKQGVISREVELRKSLNSEKMKLEEELDKVRNEQMGLKSQVLTLSSELECLNHQKINVQTSENKNDSSVPISDLLEKLREQEMENARLQKEVQTLKTSSNSRPSSSACEHCSVQ
ncbi:unnamed protein product [Blepharisma stoltei]|uniref:FYVE-type domain-containing protein n=1 Tax=Blepharisma stoltei TaxID=1481888 RepID=A0AAU9JTI2_9CILI|nr:unnamed protein product [Blepharisma stoltei]